MQMHGIVQHPMRIAGRVYSLLKNWPERRVKAICLTDGERVGYLGDLGVQAVGVPISKLALYSACAGIPPNMCLPVCIDAGWPQHYKSAVLPNLVPRSCGLCTSSNLLLPGFCHAGLMTYTSTNLTDKCCVCRH